MVAAVTMSNLWCEVCSVFICFYLTRHSDLSQLPQKISIVSDFPHPRFLFLSFNPFVTQPIQRCCDGLPVFTLPFYSGCLSYFFPVHFNLKYLRKSYSPDLMYKSAVLVRLYLPVSSEFCTFGSYVFLSFISFEKHRFVQDSYVYRT